MPESAHSDSKGNRSKGFVPEKSLHRFSRQRHDTVTQRVRAKRDPIVNQEDQKGGEVRGRERGPSGHNRTSLPPSPLVTTFVWKLIPYDLRIQVFVFWLEVKLQVTGCLVTYRCQNMCVCVYVYEREKENCSPALVISPLILKTFIPFNHDHQVPMPHSLSCFSLWKKHWHSGWGQREIRLSTRKNRMGVEMRGLG